MKTKTKKPKHIAEISELEEHTSYQAPLAWWGAAQEEASVLSRWMALYEAVNIIGDKCDEKGIPLESINFNPLDIRDYMRATENIYLRKILKLDYKIDLCYEENSSELTTDIS